MRPYETMIIFDTSVEEPAMSAVLGRVNEAVRAGGGTPGQLTRWGKRPLAYELDEHREGYYVLLEFTAEPSLPAELDRMLILADEVLRHKVVRVPDKVVGRAPAGPPADFARPSRSGPDDRGPRRRSPGTFASQGRPAPAGSRAAPTLTTDRGAPGAPSLPAEDAMPGSADAGEAVEVEGSGVQAPPDE
ncbi:MAG: 30S ribosomal protein S6 [Acidimicrobiales bacterium]